jgi:hypothetical protein
MIRESMAPKPVPFSRRVTYRTSSIMKRPWNAIWIPVLVCLLTLGCGSSTGKNIYKDKDKPKPAEKEK